MNKPSSLLMNHALAYVSSGFKVFPLKQGGKKPLTEHGLLDATANPLQVNEYWSKWPEANIGIVTDGLLVLDFDESHGGLISKLEIEAKYGSLPKTRVHRTGGGGEHWIYKQPPGSNIRNTTGWAGYKGVDIRANGGYIVVPPSLHESGTRYEVINDTEIMPAPAWAVELSTKKQVTHSEALPEGLSILKGTRNMTLTSLAGTMRGRGMSQIAIEAALLIENNRCQPPLPEGEVKAIAKSVARYAPNGTNSHVHIYTNRTELSTNKPDKNRTENQTVSLQKDTAEVSRFESLSKKVHTWIEGTNGWWETSELDRDMGINTIKDKENRQKILLRLRERGIIEPHQKVNKQFRYVNKKLTSLDFKGASNAGVLPVKWPLGIEKYVNLYAGNMAVIAGSPNSGKTAMILDFIYQNQDAFPIHYFCSEMGDMELRDRLDMFPGMDLEDWKFRAYERVSDFADVIVPDCVNIIDFLEMTTDLFMVNTHLTNISHKLGSGIAIVAIQKKQDAKYGRGQEFGLEKPKLYLSMDKGRLIIVKGKSWANQKVDPNGLQINFKIMNGCQFQETSKWDRAEK